MTTVSIVGASGYTGGELLRLLLDHPHVEVKQATSERQAGKFVHGIPELHREAIKEADFISGSGCTATTAILGLYPLFRAGIVDLSMPTVIESKVGSSGGGGESGPGSHHPERSGVIRSFKP